MLRTMVSVWFLASMREPRVLCSNSLSRWSIRWNSPASRPNSSSVVTSSPPERLPWRTSLICLVILSMGARKRRV